MFEIGDKVWYCADYSGHGAYVPAVITSVISNPGPFASVYCRKEGARSDSRGYLYQFVTRACHLCGAATNTPGYPLCPDCIEAEAEEERDTRDEREQRRRPL